MIAAARRDAAHQRLITGVVCGGQRRSSRGGPRRSTDRRLGGDDLSSSVAAILRKSRGDAVTVPAYACLVSALDDDLNDVAGIRLPDITVPIGTHVGWNVLDTAKHTSEHVPVLQGMTRFFSRDEAERERLRDPRVSIAARYPTRAAYLDLVRAEAATLVGERFLLADDVDLVVENCGARYDEARRVGPYSPAPN